MATFRVLDKHMDLSQERVQYFGNVRNEKDELEKQRLDITWVYTGDQIQQRNTFLLYGQPTRCL